MIGSIVAAGTPIWFMVAHSAGETIEGLTDAQGQPRLRRRPLRRRDLPAGQGVAANRPRLMGARVPHHPRAVQVPARHRSPPGWLPRGFISTQPLEDIVRRTSGEGWSPHEGMRVVACDYATGTAHRLRPPQVPQGGARRRRRRLLRDPRLLPPGDDRRPALRRRRHVLDLEPRHPARRPHGHGHLPQPDLLPPPHPRLQPARVGRARRPRRLGPPPRHRGAHDARPRHRRRPHPAARRKTSTRWAATS